jgi:hypothetical protein
MLPTTERMETELIDNHWISLVHAIFLAGVIHNSGLRQHQSPNRHAVGL